MNAISLQLVALMHQHIIEIPTSWFHFLFRQLPQLDSLLCCIMPPNLMHYTCSLSFYLRRTLYVNFFYDQCIFSFGTCVTISFCIILCSVLQNWLHLSSFCLHGIMLPLVNFNPKTVKHCIILYFLIMLSDWV